MLLVLILNSYFVFVLLYIRRFFHVLSKQQNTFFIKTYFVLDIGQWKSGHKNGFGITTSWLGHSFLGANLNDNLEGYGILTVTDGTKYEGKYANNDPHGIHEVTFLNGTRAMAAGSRGPSGLTWRLVDSLVQQ